MPHRTPSNRATRVLVHVLSASLVWPVHAAPIVFSQLPPASATPPAPNVIVTLDDSGSMSADVDYEPGLEYPVPPGPDGNPFRPMPPAPIVYSNGYANCNAPPVQCWVGKAEVTGGASFVSGSGTGTVNLSGDPRYKAAANKDAWRRWYSFYRTRNMAMKASVMRTFHQKNIPDGKVRLAWQGLTATCSNGFPASNFCPTANTIWPLSDSEGSRAHRTNFYNWVVGVPASGGTPLPAAYERVGQYVLRTGLTSPWAHLPGTTQLPEVSCRRSYHVMFTDGGWGGAASSGDVDNTPRTLPDGVAYSAQRPYGHNWANTLSDLAFKYWATDLQTGTNFPNDLSPIMRVAGPQSFANTSVAPYWNPNNNPATWQHLSLLAIAFGGAAELNNPKWEGSTTGGVHFAQIVAGTRQWPTTVEPDLWHAAVNSRGSMFSATDQSALDAAFKSAMDEIASQNVSVGGAASSYSVSGDSFRIVRAGYLSSPNLRGTFVGFGLASSGSLNNTELWDANAELAKVNAATRTVITARRAQGWGVAFRWNELGSWQQGELNKSLAGAGDNFGSVRVDYLRGDTSRELAPGNVVNAAGGAFRWREGALLGTIVNSEPKIVQAPRSGYTSADYQAFRNANLNRTAVAYVGANDGMLHGFATSNGKPLISYVPRGVYPNLSAYTDPTFKHRMYVDGPIITADWHDGSSWRTILIGGLGAGGRGLFGLDITNPADFMESKANSIVRFDYTAPPVAQTSATFLTESGSGGLMGELASDLGHIATDPSRDAYLGRNLQVSKMRNGKWALITGNGINSVNERAALYIIYLDGSGFRKLLPETTTGQGNGLATPLPVDVDSDGLVDVVYAGDMRGRLWKFDLANKDDTQWKVAQVSGVNTPLIDTGRPITSAPAVAQHPAGGLLVTFGSGRAMTDDDRASTATEYLYGVWDKPGGPLQVTLASLVERTLSADSASVTGGNTYARVLGSASTPVDYNTKRGWRIALGISKERVVFNPIVQGRLAYYTTYIPATTSSCAVRENGSLLTFDVIDGAQPSTPVIDINGDGLFSNADRIAGKDVMGRSTGIGRLIGLLEAPAGSSAAAGCSGDMIMGSSGMICAKKPPGPGRRAWRDMRP